MGAVGWRLAPGSRENYSSYYQTTKILLGDLQGNNWADKRIVNTFEKVLSIHLSEAEANGFLQYLLLKDPYYPSWEKPTCFWEPRKPPNQELKNCVNVYENENRFLVELESFRAKQLR
mgnify:CR=1 FL=1